VPNRGHDLFRIVQRQDLDGILARRKADVYTPRAQWFNIENTAYSQAEERYELFGSGKQATNARWATDRCLVGERNWGALSPGFAHPRRGRDNEG
jgi:hypothetical protein